MSTDIAKTETQKTPAAVRPRVDIYENEAEFLVLADLPGVAKEAIDIRFEANELVIEARRDTATATASTLLAQEYREAPFARAFTLPDGVDGEKIEARLERGVLTVKLPKVAAKRPRRIQIQAS